MPNYSQHIPDRNFTPNEFGNRKNPANGRIFYLFSESFLFRYCDSPLLFTLYDFRYISFKIGIKIGKS